MGKEDKSEKSGKYDIGSASFFLEEQIKQVKIVEYASIGQIEAVKNVLDQGYDADEKDNYGNCAVLAAASRNDMEMLRLLTETGKANLDVKDFAGRSALDWARENDNPEMEHYISKEIEKAQSQKRSNK